LRHESEAEAGRDHCQDPIIALAAVDSFNLGAVAGEDIPRKVHLLAIDAIKIALAIEIADAHRVSCRKMMATSPAR